MSTRCASRARPSYGTGGAAARLFRNNDDTCSGSVDRGAAGPSRRRRSRTARSRATRRSCTPRQPRRAHRYRSLTGSPRRNGGNSWRRRAGLCHTSGGQGVRRPRPHRCPGATRHDRSNPAASTRDPRALREGSVSIAAGTPSSRRAGGRVGMQTAPSGDEGVRSANPSSVLLCRALRRSRPPIKEGDPARRAAEKVRKLVAEEGVADPDADRHC